LFFLSSFQARSVRDKAVSGQISDAERRNQAAVMARKISDLLRLDESDGDEEG
jgi:hypothetical protein